jgi:Fic family protein
MQADRFQTTIFGRATSRPGDRWGFTYYHPNDLPRDLVLNSATVLALSEADSALGLLSGLGRLVHEPEMLLGPFLTREALASSRIEGTKATLADVLHAEGVETGEVRTDDIAEVERYLEANHLGLSRIQELPITQRLLRELHNALVQGVRGENKTPGELRKTPVWVGSPTATIDTARFVPPLPEFLPDLLSDWEKFVNDACSLPTLVRCALAHYQFETIHPFLDGNGRIGRLVVGLMLLVEKRLSKPILYLSGYLETHRDEYYDRLQAVRERGEIQEYLQFFLRAVKAQSDDAVERAGRLVELREKYSSQSRLERSRVAALIPMIFRNPFLTTSRVARQLAVTPQGARNLLERAHALGWITEYTTLGRGRVVWVAGEVLNVIEAPLSYEDLEPPAGDVARTMEG